MTTRPHRGAIIGRALASLVTMALLLTAIPWALATFGGWPIHHIPTLTEITTALAAPDDGTLLRSTLIVVGWVAWATYAVSLLLAIPAYLTGRRVPRLPGLRLQQRQVAGLIGAIAALSTLSAPAAAMASTHSAGPAPHAAPAVAAAPAAPTVTTPTTHTPDTHIHTVRRGETLWKIARDELGEGDRYEQIAKATAGVAQPDGGRLVDPDHIETGWQVVIPTPAPRHSSTPTPAPTTPGADHKVVRQKQRPSAVTDTPAPSAAPTQATSPSSQAPVEAREQAPSAALPTPPSAPTTTPATTAPTGTAATPTRAQEQPSTTNPAAETTPSTTAERAPTSLLSQSRTTYGLGAVGAALLLLLLARRRAMAGRHRRPGRRIKVPTGQAAITETQTRAGADEAAAEYLSRALRALGAYFMQANRPLPALRAARLGQNLELYFTHPTDLPAPFVPDPDSPDIWILEPSGVVDLPSLEDLADIPAPWPTLVTLGSDADNGAILVCLEEIASLTISGDARTSADTLAAIAAELIASPWADDMTRITLVGTLTDLAPHLGSPRVNVADSVDEALTLLEASADEHQRVLDKSGAPDIATARSQSDTEGWAPHLVLLAQELDLDELERLRAVLNRMPRVAIASVTTTSTPVGEWVLNVQDEPTPTAVLEPAGLTLIPHVLPPAALADLVEAFTLDGPTDTNDPLAPGTLDEASQHLDAPDLAESHTHDTGGVAGPSWAASIPATTPDPAALPTPIGVSLMDQPAATSLDTALHAEDTPDLTDTGELEVLTHAPYDLDTPDNDDLDIASRTPAPTSGATDEAPEIHARQRLEDLLDSRPLIRLLTPTPQILNPAGPKPESPGLATEALAYLALHPGQSHTAFSEAIWPGQQVRAGKRNKLLSYTRTWLGTNIDGNPYVAIVDTDAYELDPTTPVDIDVFLDLIGNDATTTPLPRLRDALALVEGQPLSGVRAGRYAWAETDRLEICASIVDIAHTLAIRSLEAGDPRTAAWAASKGLDADPIAEILWRDALTAAHQAHDHTRITELVQRLHITLDALDAEPEDATADLIDQLTAVHA